MIRTVDNVFRLLVIGSVGFGWNLLFLSCNLIGQFCLSDPGNSSRTVTCQKENRGGIIQAVLHKDNLAVHQMKDIK